MSELQKITRTLTINYNAYKRIEKDFFYYENVLEQVLAELPQQQLSLLHIKQIYMNEYHLLT